MDRQLHACQPQGCGPLPRVLHRLPGHRGRGRQQGRRHRAASRPERCKVHRVLPRRHCGPHLHHFPSHWVRGPLGRQLVPGDQRRRPPGRARLARQLPPLLPLLQKLALPRLIHCGLGPVLSCLCIVPLYQPLQGQGAARQPWRTPAAGPGCSRRKGGNKLLRLLQRLLQRHVKGLLGSCRVWLYPSRLHRRRLLQADWCRYR